MVRTRGDLRREGALRSVNERDGYAIFRSAIEATQDDVTRMTSHGLRGASIFNPDKRRLQNELDAGDPLLRQLTSLLEREGLMRGRFASTAVALVSLDGCQRQQLHTDYDTDVIARAPVKPLGVLVALQDGTRLGLRGDDAQLNTGDVLVFDGDLVHAGAAYKKINVRLHMYLDVPECRREHNATYFVEANVKEANVEAAAVEEANVEAANVEAAGVEAAN